MLEPSMITKYAAHLTPGDGVQGGPYHNRVAEKVHPATEPIDSLGTAGTWVWWHGHSEPSLIARHEELTVINVY